MNKLKRRLELSAAVQGGNGGEKLNEASRNGVEKFSNGHLEGRLLTVEQASAYLHLHPQTIYVMAKTGELPVLRIGRAVRFDKLALDRWIQKKVEENEQKLLPWSDDPC